MRNRFISRAMLGVEPLELRVMLCGTCSAHDDVATPQTSPSQALAAVPLVGSQKLPDLVALADQAQGYVYDYIIDRTEMPGRTLLRFSTSVGNAGVGAIELRGGATNPTTGTQIVNQRIYDTAGGFSDRVAGTFIYHPEHGHIHFDNFAAYSLRTITTGNGVGAVVAGGDKTSFCLLDIAQFNPNLPGSPSGGHYNSCGQLQGISVGWNDVYDRGLPDQWVDVTNVPDGQYWLEVIADPDNRILESSETNNTVRIQIDLHAQIIPLQPDRFEPNDSFASATNLGTVGKRVETDLSMHMAGNNDFFKFTAASTGAADVDITFDGSKGDIDMQAFDASLNLLSTSDSIGNSEHISMNVQAGKVYYVQVIGFAGATSPSYDLTVNVPQAVSIALSDSSAKEPGSDTGAFTITRTGATGSALTVQYTVTGTATSGSDYQALSGSVTFSVLETSKTIRVTPIDDTSIESTETVKLTLKAGSGYTLGTSSSATLNILDNDGTFTDTHDQISEAYDINVGASSGNRSLTMGQQVDMYRFYAKAGQKIGFDIDRTSGSTFDSYLRIFAASGAQLIVNDNGAAPGESAGVTSYVEYTFSKAGKYYVAVSGRGNSAYSPNFGNHDTPGSSGGYNLTLTSLTPPAAAKSLSFTTAQSSFSSTAITALILDDKRDVLV